jgi:cytochrome c553
LLHFELESAAIAKIYFLKYIEEENMSCTRINITAGLVIVLFSATSVFADDSPDDIKQRIGAGDPVAGKEKSALCQNCHGEDGNSASSDFPKLAGQYAVYIQKQIKDFQAGSRKNEIMTDMAATVTDNQDLLDISAYFASQQKMKGEKPVFTKGGQTRFTLEGNGCKNCHGVNGKGLAPNSPYAPVIGGQHREYLIKQLKAFQTLTRDNDGSGMMSWIAQNMTDEEIEEIAYYESGL